MGSLLVVVVVTLLVYSWLKAARRARDRWLRRLDLPGSWSWEGHKGRLELSGNLSNGGYRLVEPGSEQKGTWRLRGHLLELTAANGKLRVYDLRYFDQGKIGLSSEGQDARIYVKTPSNVVPLRSRSG